MLTEVTIKLTIKSLPILVLYNGSFKLLVGCSTKILHVLERNSSTNSIEVLLNVFLLIMEKKKKGGKKKKPLVPVWKSTVPHKRKGTGQDAEPDGCNTKQMCENRECCS